MQVLKSIVKELGYHVPDREKRKRQANLNFPGYDVNIPRRVQGGVLKAKKKDLLAKGEIEAGEKIVPIEYEVLRVDSDGNLVCNQISFLLEKILCQPNC